MAGRRYSCSRTAPYRCARHVSSAPQPLSVGTVLYCFKELHLNCACGCVILSITRRQMIGALEVVARLCALGLGLDKEAITSLMHEGPHLLAPTGEGTRRLTCSTAYTLAVKTLTVNKNV